MTHRIFMWVQSRVGLGHLARSLNLCEALAHAGFNVTLAHGGMPVSTLSIPKKISFVQLPPAQAPDLARGQILDSDGHYVTDAWRKHRTQALRSAITNANPDIVLTETFPFGRRIFGFEWLEFLERRAGRGHRPFLVASLRDVVTRPKGDGKAQGMADIANAHYDLILVHGDPRIIRVEENFPELGRITTDLRYTGYIGGAKLAAPSKRSGVIISAGGGAVGEPIFRAAIAAKSQFQRHIGPWTLVTGPHADASLIAEVRHNAPDDLTVETSIPNLAARYRNAALVVTQAGYNTVVEVLSAGAPLVVVPYETDKETEQSLRAQRMSKLGLLTHLPAASLSADSLCAAMESALDHPPTDIAPDFSGGETSAAILAEMLSRIAL